MDETQYEISLEAVDKNVIRCQKLKNQGQFIASQSGQFTPCRPITSQVIPYRPLPIKVLWPDQNPNP